MTKEDRKNAYLYCKFRDEQFALYDEYAKRNGMMMKTLLVVNALYYDAFYNKGGMTQKEICQRTFQSKQTVNLIIKNLLAEKGTDSKYGARPLRRALQTELEDRMAFGRSYQHGVVSSLAFRNVLALDGRGIPAAKIRNPNSSCLVVFFLYFSGLDGSGRPIR